ncbi:hypothetical protein [Thermospira aquatica]|nr:hypothetical protein [Thermospira aquatica]
MTIRKNSARVGIAVLFLLIIVINLLAVLVLVTRWGGRASGDEAL